MNGLLHPYPALQKMLLKMYDASETAAGYEKPVRTEVQ